MEYMNVNSSIKIRRYCDTPLRETMLCTLYSIHMHSFRLAFNTIFFSNCSRKNGQNPPRDVATVRVFPIKNIFKICQNRSVYASAIYLLIQEKNIVP